jgi:hypothetical protein
MHAWGSRGGGQSAGQGVCAGGGIRAPAPRMCCADLLLCKPHLQHLQRRALRVGATTVSGGGWPLEVALGEHRVDLAVLGAGADEGEGHRGAGPAPATPGFRDMHSRPAAHKIGVW